MSTASGVFSPTRDAIIRRALRQCIAIESGETPGAQEISDANEALNAMVAEWQASGIHVWTETEGIIFLQPNQIKYSLGGTNTDQACYDANWVQTTATNGLAIGGTSLLLGSVSGIASGHNIGVMMSTNALFWTTVNGAPVGNTVTLTAGPPTAVLAGAIVVDYAPAFKMLRPLRIKDARRFYLPSLIETPLIRMARLDYRDMPNKNTQGTISSFFYDPQVGTSPIPGQGYNWVWPAPPDSNSAMKCTWYRPIGNFSTAADTPDFPQEWTNALTWNLAEEIAPEYGVGQMRMAVIAAKAAKSLALVQGWDKEPESYYFGVNFEQSTR